MKKMMIAALAAFLGTTVSYSQQTTIRVVPVLLPTMSSPSFNTAAGKVIADSLAGNLATNRSVSIPTDYAVCGYRIGWSNLVYSTTNHTWQGHLNPVSPFASEYGQIVWILIDANSSNGTDSVSLDSLTASSVSSDNLLNISVNFVGRFYSPLAVAVMSNGTVVSSGAASQKGKRVLVLVQFKLFNGGDTQNGLDQVGSWIANRGDYRVTYKAQVAGDASSLSSVVLSTMNDPIPPRLSMGTSISVINPETDRTYLIKYRTSAKSGLWLSLGQISGTNSISIPKTLPVCFYRASVQ